MRHCRWRTAIVPEGRDHASLINCTHPGAWHHAPQEIGTQEIIVVLMDRWMNKWKQGISERTSKLTEVMKLCEVVEWTQTQVTALTCLEDLWWLLKSRNCSRSVGGNKHFLTERSLNIWSLTWGKSEMNDFYRFYFL